jgi:site-specific DNA recombinase
MNRVLIVVRLSRVTDATTSPERQLQTCRELCEQRGYEVVGIAEDLDVSAGSTSPFDRPQLGHWLTNRLDEFDVLVFFRADRIVRRLFDLADLIRWARDHSVTLVSATESYFDLSTDFGDIIALLVAKVAEMELAAISERNASAARHNIKAGKYRGGVPPWGYLPDDSTGEWRFVPDPEQVRVIHEVVRRVLDGEPLRAVAHDLTARGVHTSRDRFAHYRGREVKGYEWHSAGLKRSLMSPTLLGHAVSGEKSVRNDDGSPVVRSEPIITREVFDRLAVELADRENRKEPTRRSSGLLLQVIFCGVCGKPAYRLKGGEGRQPRYRCASAQYKKTCGNKSIPMDRADHAVESILLRMLGESERLERVWESGSDHSAELTEVNDRLTDLVSQLGIGAFRAGTPQRAALNHQIEMLAERQAALSAQEVTPAGWAWQPTGETFGDWWVRQDVSAKNIELRRMNVRLEFEPGQFRLDLGDLETMTQQMVARGTAARWQELFDVMRESGIQGMTVGRDGEIEFTPAE